MQLSIIIVNYNVKYFLEQCLCSVIKAIENIEAEIFVVDNNSSDGSKAFFLNKFAGIKFIWNGENIGFSKANNLALKQATGKFIVFLNPDTLLPEDCFKKAISFFESQSCAGALGVKMIDGSGNFLKESKRSFPSPVTSFYKLSGLSHFFPHSKKFSKYHLGHLDNNKNHEVDVLAGAFMMTTQKVINKTGSFDEDFFMYGEDIDLSYRIQQSGYKNFYFSEISIIHFKGESTKQGSLNYIVLFYKAMSKFARKHYGSRAVIFNFFLQLGIYLRALISGIKSFIKWIGVPIIDGCIILMSFWFVEILWNLYIKKDVSYSTKMLMTGLAVFTFIFIITCFYSGLYNKEFRQKNLNYSSLIAFFALLCVCALLPERLRFSRGILVLGSLVAYVLMTVERRLLANWKIINKESDKEHRRTLIVCEEDEFNKVIYVMRNAGMEERVLGRVNVNDSENLNTCVNLFELASVLKKYAVKEIIFCQGSLSFKKIISLIPLIPNHIRIKFYASSASGIIGSNIKI